MFSVGANVGDVLCTNCGNGIGYNVSSGGVGCAICIGRGSFAIFDFESDDR
jgi:hypothetical protein